MGDSDIERLLDDLIEKQSAVIQTAEEQFSETERAESRTGSDSVDNMDKNELRDLISEVVDEKMAEALTEATEEKTEDEPSDLEEIKSMLADLKESADDSDEEEKAGDGSEDLAEIKEMLGQIAGAQGVSQQADNGQRASEKTWDRSPFVPGGER